MKKYYETILDKIKETEKLLEKLKADARKNEYVNENELVNLITDINEIYLIKLNEITRSLIYNLDRF